MHCVSTVSNVLLFILLFVVNSTSPSECYRKYLWNNFQEATGKFDNPFYAAASSDLLEKNSHQPSGTKTSTLVVSPLLLELLLVVLSLGANGQTLREIDDGTNFVETEEDKMKMLEYYKENIIQANPHMNLEIITMIFLNTGLKLKDSYREFVTTNFNITINHVDFTSVTQSRITMNKMITQQTSRKMMDVFEDKDLKPNGTSIVLVSSIYFKNRWLYPPTILNGTYEFRNNTSGLAFNVRMFRLNGMMQFANLPECDAKVVEIPYITEGLSMLVFLPNRLNGLKTMEKELLKHENILEYYKRIMTETPVAISLPIYAAEINVLLPSKLMKMNITKIFNENAELDGMVDNENVSISNAVQRIKFWADAGRGAFKDTGEIELPIPKETMFADHPFFFIVKMNDTSFLMGHFIV